MADEVLVKAAEKASNDPSKINPKLAALSLAKDLMSGDNPTTAVISGDFCLGNAILQNINKSFFCGGLDGVTSVFNEFERHSPSISGVGRQQVVECVVNASRPVYQGFSPMQEDNKPGLIERFAAFMRGGKSEKQ